MLYTLWRKTNAGTWEETWTSYDYEQLKEYFDSMSCDDYYVAYQIREPSGHVIDSKQNNEWG